MYQLRALGPALSDLPSSSSRNGPLFHSSQPGHCPNMVRWRRDSEHRAILDRRTNMLFAHAVPRKGLAHEHGPPALLNMWQCLGITKWYSSATGSQPYDAPGGGEACSRGPDQP